jgi:hypothetical protein
VGREVTAEVIPEYIKKQGKQTRHKNSDCSERNPAPWGGVIHSLLAIMVVVSWTVGLRMITKGRNETTMNVEVQL